MIALLVFLGGLTGALGVALSAIAAHYPGADHLGSAANFLLFHAPLFLVFAAFAKIELMPRWLLAALGLVFVTGLALFAGDLASRVLRGVRLFHWAAPLGGSTLIAGWLALAASGLFARR